MITQLRWPLAVVVVFALLVWGWLQWPRAAMDAITGPLKTVNVTTRFVSSFPQVSRTKGGVLELATARVPETFQRSDEQFLGWLSLGETISEIRVPVTYRFHLELAGDWRVTVSGQICRVVAPPVEPSLPAAVHLEEMEKHTRSGWARFDSLDQMKQLEKEVGIQVNERASTLLDNFEIREQCRRTVREFVETWLLKNAGWRSDEFHTIEVRFPDELQQIETPVSSPIP